MNVDWITIHCSKHSNNQNPRVLPIGNSQDGGAFLNIVAGDNQYEKITFFMSQQDLINFKNSVISAVDNYKRGNK